MRSYYQKKVATAVAWKLYGLPYRWGGDDSLAGFDCSGFCIEVLKSAGRLPRKGDWTAQGLYDYFLSNVIDRPKKGALVFWKNAEKIYHVEFCLNKYFSIGATSGGSTTTTIEEAIKDVLKIEKGDK